MMMLTSLLWSVVDDDDVVVVAMILLLILIFTRRVHGQPADVWCECRQAVVRDLIRRNDTKHRH